MSDQAKDCVLVEDGEVFFRVNGCAVPQSKAKFWPDDVIERVAKMARDRFAKGEGSLLLGSLRLPQRQRIRTGIRQPLPVV